MLNFFRNHYLNIRGKYEKSSFKTQHGKNYYYTNYRSYDSTACSVIHMFSQRKTFLLSGRNCCIIRRGILSVPIAFSTQQRKNQYL